MTNRWQLSFIIFFLLIEQGHALEPRQCFFRAFAVMLEVAPRKLQQAPKSLGVYLQLSWGGKLWHRVHQPGAANRLSDFKENFSGLGEATYYWLLLPTTDRTKWEKYVGLILKPKMLDSQACSCGFGYCQPFPTNVAQGSIPVRAPNFAQLRNPKS